MPYCIHGCRTWQQDSDRGPHRDPPRLGYHSSVRNLELAELFHEAADLLEIREENVFRVRAYRRAAQQLENLGEDVVEALDAGRKVPGIGADLAAKIREYAGTGAIAYLEELRKELPRGVRQLLGLQGVGPKTAKLFYRELGIDSVDRLEAACRSGRILEVPGIKQKTAENILRGIETWKLGQARMPLGRAMALAEALVTARTVVRVEPGRPGPRLSRWQRVEIGRAHV